MTDEFAEKLQSIIKLQPNIITNDRLKRPNFTGDFKTPEQKIPNLSELDGKDWETCMTMNGSWGWRSYNPNFKSSEVLIRNLIDIASKGGNYLLNVGPTAEGEFPQESIEGLKAIGNWIKVNGESIYGTQTNPLKPFSWGRCTTKDINGNSILYLSVFNWPSDNKLIIEGIDNDILSAKLLANGNNLKVMKSVDILTVNLPTISLDKIATVIKIELKGKIERSNSPEQKKLMKTGELD
jgi:alpha-L-fucosidase